eukprot:TRINITY_DN74353_c0_g1_i2.p1 TRINITY_DN74353_c0_g1~~TRINITY_DN74353_c0_g1_i2.p1  ORF type:complete len:165 (+),score=25.78 TRINITY_DN74353_c0_g1_i2:3-497(+)
MSLESVVLSFETGCAHCKANQVAKLEVKVHESKIECGWYPYRCQACQDVNKVEVTPEVVRNMSLQLVRTTCQARSASSPIVCGHSQSFYVVFNSGVAAAEDYKCSKCGKKNKVLFAKGFKPVEGAVDVQSMETNYPGKACLCCPCGMGIACVVIFAAAGCGCCK